MLAPDFDADAGIVALFLSLQHGTQAGVVRPVVVIQDIWRVLGAADVLGSVVMEIRGESKRHAIGDGVGPVKAHQVVAFSRSRSRMPAAWSSCVLGI